MYFSIFQRTKGDACIMRRIFAISVIIGIIIICTSALVFGTGIGRADDTPPNPTPGTFTSGTWQGQGSLNSGSSVFDMALTLNVTNTTFAGDMRSVALGSEALVNGAVSSTFGNIIGITFIPSKIIQGNQIQLGSVYNATVVDGRIRGSWTLQGNPSVLQGSFTLDPVPPTTPTPNQPQPPVSNPIPTQSAALPPAVPTPAPTAPSTNQSQYVPSGNGQQANVTAILTWYGFDDNSSPAGGKRGSVAITHPKNAGNPTLHDQATEGSGTFDDPITFSVRDNDQQTFPIGSVIYVPLVHKYYIMEDTCGDTNLQNCQKGTHHVGLWMGPSKASGNALVNCESKSTPTDAVQVIINPSSSLPVDITPEFSNGQCSLHTY
jgi:hypothetical protein